MWSKIFEKLQTMNLVEFEKEGKAILFKNVKGSKYAVVSNLFGSLKRSHFMFRDSLEIVKQLIDLKTNPISAIKNPIKSLFTALNGIYSIPQKVAFPKSFNEIQIEDLPQIKCWKDDGGAFITLPQVYSEDPAKEGVMNSNLGMYRIQLNGNDYKLNKEIGLHYQIHRGIGVHQAKANKLGKPLKVSIFIGGPPAHTLAAVMPLPEGLSEVIETMMCKDPDSRYITSTEAAEDILRVRDGVKPILVDRERSKTNE